jgi:hypothetical protein
VESEEGENGMAVKSRKKRQKIMPKKEVQTTRKVLTNMLLAGFEPATSIRWGSAYSHCAFATFTVSRKPTK